MTKNEALAKARWISDQLPGIHWRSGTMTPNGDYNGFAVRESLFNPLVFKVYFENNVAVVYLNDKFLATGNTVPEAWTKAMELVRESLE